jgi:hypothetical protein
MEKIKQRKNYYFKAIPKVVEMVLFNKKYPRVERGAKLRSEK